MQGGVFSSLSKQTHNRNNCAIHSCNMLVHTRYCSNPSLLVHIHGYRIAIQRLNESVCVCLFVCLQYEVLELYKQTVIRTSGKERKRKVQQQQQQQFQLDCSIQSWKISIVWCCSYCECRRFSSTFFEIHFSLLFQSPATVILLYTAGECYTTL